MQITNTVVLCLLYNTPQYEWFRLCYNYVNVVRISKYITLYIIVPTICRYLSYIYYVDEFIIRFLNRPIRNGNLGRILL